MELSPFSTIERVYGLRSRGHFHDAASAPDVTGQDDVHDSPWRYHSEVRDYYQAGPTRSEGQKLSSGDYLKAADMTPAEREFTTSFTYTSTGETVSIAATQQKAKELALAGTPSLVKRRESLAKFAGCVLASLLWVDIDESGDLALAHDHAKETVSVLEQYGVPLDLIRVNFSGSKGFHVLFPSACVGLDLLGPQPAPLLAKRLAKTMPALFPHADPQCYGPTQVLRVPNTRNTKSGLFCVPLSVDELRTLSIEQIKSLAAAPRQRADAPQADLLQVPPVPALRAKFEDLFRQLDAHTSDYASKRLYAGSDSITCTEALVQWLNDNRWPHDAPVPRDGGCTIIRLRECPTGPHSAQGDHGSFMVFEQGNFIFSCFHTGCRPKRDPVSGRDDVQACTQTALTRITARNNVSLTLRTPEKKRDFTVLANGVAADYFTREGQPSLRHHRSTFYAYQGTGYRELEPADLDNQIMHWLRLNAPAQADRYTGDNLRAHLAAIGAVPSTQAINTWMDDSHAQGDYLAFRNGVLNLTSFLRGLPLEECFHAHSPLFFGSEAVPFDFDPAAKCPGFLKFLEQVQPDADARQFLQEFSGYTFTNRCDYQTMAFLFGSGSNGKNTFGDILAGLHGPGDVTSIPISSFGDRFSLWPLGSSRLCYVSEVPTASPGGSFKLAEEKLKSVISGDLIQAERKNRDTYTVRPIAKLLILGNELPSLYDRSDGIWRRIVMIHFPVRIAPEQANRNLARDLLAAESSGIFNWAIEGLKRLHQRGHIIEPAASASLKSEHKLAMQHEVQFLMDHYACVGAGELPKGDPGTAFPTIYGQYKTWAELSGFLPVGSNKFGEAIAKLFPEARKLRKVVASSDGSGPQKVMYYVGLLPIHQSAEVPGSLPSKNTWSPKL